MFKVHGYLGKKMVLNHIIPHIPSKGDTIRFSDKLFGKVTEII